VGWKILQWVETGLYFLQPSLRSPDCSLKSSAVGQLDEKRGRLHFYERAGVQSRGKVWKKLVGRSFWSNLDLIGDQINLALDGNWVAGAIATYDVSK